MSNVKNVEVRWADLDPNFHVLHSRYYDFCAYARTCMLQESGVTPEVMVQYHCGPILFREECTFRREIRFGDRVEVHTQLLKARKDQSRWSFRHQIILNGETLAAVLQVDGAWMDTHRRRLTTPPELFTKALSEIPRAEEFTWMDE